MPQCFMMRAGADGKGQKVLPAGFRDLLGLSAGGKQFQDSRQVITCTGCLKVCIPFIQP